MDLSHFDHFFDAVAAIDNDGVVSYCNEAFSQLVGFSANRIVGKAKISKLFQEIDGKEVNLDDLRVNETSNVRVITYKTKVNETGIGQYCLIPGIQQNKRFTLFVMRDLSLEEQLKDKYKKEMDSKDRKIDEMKMLINLLQKTRMVKDSQVIIKEFAAHILAQFKLDRAYVLTPEKVISAVYATEKPASDPLLISLPKAQLPEQYLVYSASDLPNLNIGFVPALEGLVSVPIRTKKRDVNYMIIVPLFSEAQGLYLNLEVIKTLSEQMTLMLENVTLEKLSINDDLTKLFNARFFREKLDEYTAKHKKLDLILLDIDYFKKVNDTYGHLAGDAVLIQMGATLKKVFVKDAVVARVGGEEFAILVPNQSNEEVLKLANDIANQIRSLEIKFDDLTLKITSSFGIATWQPGKMIVRDFYKAADEALYQSKKDGRNRITLYKAS